MAAIAPSLIAPPVSDGTLINGVAHFVRNTTPTVRVDGSALVVGDRWYKTSDSTEWFWNGTYWLTVQIYEGVDLNTVISTTPSGGNTARLDPTIGNIFVLKWLLGGFFATANDVNNFYRMRLGAPPNTSSNFIAESNSHTWTLNVLTGWYYADIPVNTYVDIQDNLGQLHFLFRGERTGTTGNYFPKNSVLYRYAHI